MCELNSINRIGSRATNRMNNERSTGVRISDENLFCFLTPNEFRNDSPSEMMEGFFIILNRHHY